MGQTGMTRSRWLPALTENTTAPHGMAETGRVPAAAGWYSNSHPSGYEDTEGTCVPSVLGRAMAYYWQYAWLPVRPARQRNTCVFQFSVLFPWLEGSHSPTPQNVRLS